MRENVRIAKSCEFLRPINLSETQNSLGKTMFRRLFIGFIGLLGLFVLTTPVQAQDRYASIIVDADTLDVLHARQIDEPRFPASLTKVMTLYLVFDEIDAGRLNLSDQITVSSIAARTPPVKMGLKAGQKISVHELIQAVAVKSYNDAAVVLAERIGGSEANFAARMTQKARDIGMMRTTFKTANGLPHPEQKTTARDMAKLANSMLKTHADRYHYFGQKYYRGQKNTNALLFKRADIDGFKTGYTRASGYNLMVSATRNNRRQIAILLGGASSATRNEHMNDLIDRGFKIMGQQPPPLVQPAGFTHNQRGFKRKKTETPVIIKLRGANSETKTIQTAGPPITLPKGGENWSVQIKGFETEALARDVTHKLRRHAKGGQPDLRSGFISGAPVYHARLAGLSAQTAQEICASRELRLALGPKRCLIIAP